MPRTGSVNGKLGRIRTHKELDVYQAAMDAAMAIFHATRKFPSEEKFSLTSQILRSSRSVYGNTAEAWRKRRYQAAFVSKLSDEEAEAAETQAHIECAVKCGYLPRSLAVELYRKYDRIIRTLVGMIHHSDDWIIPTSTAEKP
jgi:four helix bundle protein